MLKRFTKITLKDIADQSRVSVATVSRVLGNSPDFRVSKGTKERILKVAQELNYRPNTMARSLRVSKTFTLGLFIPNIGNPVFPQIVQGIEDGAAERGYTVFISHLTPQTIEKKLYISWLQENRVDALIMATSTLDDETVADLNDQGLPFVLVNRRDISSNNYVIMDDTAGAKMAVEHLIEQGHRRIAHLAGLLMFDTAVRRLQGYRQALAAADLPYDGELVEESDWTNWNHGRESMARLLNRRPRPTAVFAGTMINAMGAIAQIRESGLKIPEDISIICMHDCPLAEVMAPPLSVVKMPLHEMGRQASLWIINSLDGQTPTNPIILPPERLIIRGSTDMLRP